jgi:hypothetical protein
MPKPHRLTRLLLCACALAATCAQADTLYYPRPESFENGQSDYGFELLQLALSKAGSKHHAELTPEYRQQNRAIVELIANRGKIHVVGTMTSVEREVEMLPVRIPISKGLIGWRILLVREESGTGCAMCTTLANCAKSGWRWATIGPTSKCCAAPACSPKSCRPTVAWFPC